MRQIFALAGNASGLSYKSSGNFFLTHLEYTQLSLQQAAKKPISNWEAIPICYFSILSLGTAKNCAQVSCFKERECLSPH